MGSLDDAVREFLIQPHNVVIYPDLMEDGSLVYMSMDPGLPGCLSDGRTPEEAEANLEDARAMYVRGLLSRDIPLPKRAVSSVGTSVSYKSVSVVLSCCEEAADDVPAIQRMSFDVPVVEPLTRV